MKAKNKKVLFITGLITMLLGISVLGVFGWKRISREYAPEASPFEYILHGIRLRKRLP